ncbi:MAG: S-methyl-5-thioribose-1-phosphate isomerase [Pseudomonadota bacterium]
MDLLAASIAIRWDDAGWLWLLDQRLLPGEERGLRIETAPAAADAIRDLVVRGAPAIGITAAYGVVLSALRHADAADPTAAVAADIATLRAARPTAVNLGWALDRMAATIEAAGGPDPETLLALAREIHLDDIAANHRMGELGAAEIEAGSAVLTHCNTGSLATGGYGTALGVIRSAHGGGRLTHVYAGETRPWLQGARLTAWELQQDGIPVDLVIEGAVASLFRSGRARWLVAGSDRIAANGDVANKIGTYSAALHARSHGGKVMIVAPFSTVDLAMPDGSGIPIEQRAADEVLGLGGRRVAAAGAGAWNPVFDITPAELVDVIVTERGVARPPFRESLAAQA